MTADQMKAKRDRAHAARRLRMQNDPTWAAGEREKRNVRQRLRYVPAGHRLQGVSKLVDDTGATLKEWQKTGLRPDEPPKYPNEPPGFTLTSQSNMTDRQGGTLIQWQRYEKDKAQQFAEMVQSMRDATAEYRGLAEPVRGPDFVDTRLINVFPIGDPHISMLAWAKETGQDFDSTIARDDLLNVMGRLFDRAPAAKTGLIAQLGDFFHAEDDKARTPMGGNPLDIDTRAGKTTRTGYLLMRSVVDAALKKHEHIVVFNLRGNHDPYKSIGLNLYLEGVYEREPRVTVMDNNDPYIFYEHGLNLFGFHHGDGAKPEMLPGIMASYLDGKPWGRASYRKWFTGHIHTRKAMDFPGVSWESCRTLAPGDFWAHHRGYRSEQSLECHTFDAIDGLVARQVVSLRMARKEAAGG